MTQGVIEARAWLVSLALMCGVIDQDVDAAQF
jgi:hypothetical protein